MLTQRICRRQDEAHRTHKPAAGEAVQAQQASLPHFANAEILLESEGGRRDTRVPRGAQHGSADTTARQHLLRHRVLTRTRVSSLCIPASIPSHSMDTATQPSLFLPGKASPSPQSKRFPSGCWSPEPHNAHRQAQAAPVYGTRCAPARSHLAGCWPGATCLETSARRNLL